jgi:cation transport protein ChaC
MRALRLTPEMVARCFRSVPEPETPPEGFTALDEEAIVARAAELLASAGPNGAGPDGTGTGPIWIFAYGSLIWKPVFAPAEARRARAWGWRRAFCIEMTSWRATPEAPGLMMALAAGGSCAGLAYRLDARTQAADLVELVRRETPYRELAANARWIRAATPEGPIRALTFYASPVGVPIQRLPDETTALWIARACGHAGSCAEYLYNTVSHLEAEGIHDRHLWRLQQLVADEISGWRPGGSGSAG